MSIHSFCESLGTNLSQKIGEPAKAPILTYGLELIIGESVKLMVLLTISYISHLLQPTIFIALTAFPLRIMTGGKHCSSNMRCSILTVSTFWILSWFTVKAMGLLNQIFLLPLAVVATLIFLATLKKYGLGDSVNYPNPNSQTVYRFKNSTLMFLSVWLTLVLALVFLASDYQHTSLIISATSVGVLWQSYMVTPWGHSFVETADKLLSLSKLK